MARDRQRAKQRRARRRETVPPGAERAGAGPLDHGSADADDAAARIALGGEAAAEPELATPPASGPEPVAEDPDVGDAVEEPGAARSFAPARSEPGAAASPARLVSFLRNSWAELQRVQWPNRQQVFQATGVVLGFVIIAGAYLGLADAVAQKIVDAII